MQGMVFMCVYEKVRAYIDGHGLQQDVKAKMYLVIIEAEAKDANGEVVERVKYGVSVVDPEKSGAYSPMSQAQNCTGMENEEIKELLNSATASFH